MKILATLFALAVSFLGMARAESLHFFCRVRGDAISVHCPQGDRGSLAHMAWLYPGMFKGNVFPKDLKPGDLLWCSVDEKDDLSDCVVQK